MPNKTELFRNGTGLAVTAALTLGAAMLGGLVSPGRSRDAGRWLKRLNKPPFQPPPRVFGPVWSALYPTVALSGYRIVRAAPSPQRDRALRWWTAQLAFNAMWSPLFFGLRAPKAALADNALLLASAANYARLAHRVDRTASWVVAPYLAWLAFAALLNAEIVRRN